MFSRLWTMISVGGTLYLFWQKIQSDQAAMASIYAELPAELQTKWVAVFGAPTVPVPVNPLQTLVATINPTAGTVLSNITGGSGTPTATTAPVSTAPSASH